MLSDSEIYKVIPKTFTICCHPIKVIIKDEIIYESNKLKGEFYLNSNNQDYSIIDK